MAQVRRFIMPCSTKVDGTVVDTDWLATMLARKSPSAPAIDGTTWGAWANAGCTAHALLYDLFSMLAETPNTAPDFNASWIAALPKGSSLRIWLWFGGFRARLAHSTFAI
eukprot:6677312-Pyramimonas_sp.AAC.1